MTTDKCPTCFGTGKFLNDLGQVCYDCTSCNGTGIRGDPRGCVVAVLLSFAVSCAIFYLVFH